MAYGVWHFKLIFGVDARLRLSIPNAVVCEFDLEAPNPVEVSSVGAAGMVFGAEVGLTAVRVGLLAKLMNFLSS